MSTLRAFGLVVWHRLICGLAGHRWTERISHNYVVRFCSRCWDSTLEKIKEML